MVKTWDSIMSEMGSQRRVLSGGVTWSDFYLTRISPNVLRKDWRGQSRKVREEATVLEKFPLVIWLFQDTVYAEKRDYYLILLLCLPIVIMISWVPSILQRLLMSFLSIIITSWVFHIFDASKHCNSYCCSNDPIFGRWAPLHVSVWVLLTRAQ